MAETTAEPVKQIGGLRKAAIVLVAMGPVASAAILKHIPEEEADRVARAIAHLDEVTPDEVELCLDEYQQYLTSSRLFIKGGIDYASKILSEAYGIEVAQRLVDRLMKSVHSEGANFENFRRTDPQQLAKFIQDEHPQTIALILSHLDPSQAATLLSSLPVETRTDVAVRMADLDQISPEIVRNIASVIEQKLRNLGELSREAYGGVRAVANIFNRLDPNTCSQMLDGIERENLTLFENIRKFMFVFRDLEDLEGSAISTLINRVNRSVLMVALKGSNDSLRQKFLATQSQRGAAMMLDDITALGPVKLKDVDAAQQEIISVAREMEKEGLISLKGSANEQYVY